MQTPFNGDYYDSAGNIRNILENGEQAQPSPKDYMSPRSGDFYASDGSVHNIEELSVGGELADIQARVSNLEAFVGYADPDIFGLEADFQNNKFTRLAGAENRTAGASFDDVECFGGRRRCIVADDGVILAYYGEVAYTETGKILADVIINSSTYLAGASAQVMVYQPKFYYKVVPLVLEPIADSVGYHVRKARYYVSDTPKNGFRIHPAFVKNEIERPYILLSAYEGCLQKSETYNLSDEQNADFTVSTGDKLSSIANAKPISGTSQNLARRSCGILAENRGDGWSQAYAATISATQMLFAIEYATFNTQTAIGLGVVNKTDNTATNAGELTGWTSRFGNVTGMVTGTNGLVSVSYRGEENPWGNLWKFVDGVNVWGDGTLRGGIAWIADNAFAENKRTDNYQSTGFTLTNASNYISAFGYGNPEFDWVFFASETSGNSSVPVGDYNYITANLNGERIARLGGRWDNGTSAGGFMWAVHFDSSVKGSNISGRLVYVPSVTERIDKLQNENNLAFQSAAPNNVFLYDDLGAPSVMVRIPKFTIGDVIDGGGSGTHPAFIVNGVEKDSIYISKYQNVVNNGRAYSLPMRDPASSIDFDQAWGYCKAKGPGWHLMTNAEWAAIALWCKKNGFMPKGNNTYGRDTGEGALPPKALGTRYGDDGRINRVATGSGRVSWYHDNTEAGIADLNGNVWEWCGGMRLNGGEINILENNNAADWNNPLTADSSQWRAIMPDGTLVMPGTVGAMKYGTAWTNTKFASIGTTPAATGAGITLLESLGLLPRAAAISDDYGHDAVWTAITGERLPRRGGAWVDWESCGVFAISLGDVRSAARANFGFRAAYYE